MIPSLRQYAPEFFKLAEYEPTVEVPTEAEGPPEKPERPSLTALKQMGLIGGGLGSGFAAGYGLGHLAKHQGLINKMTPRQLGAAGAVLGGGSSLAGMLMHQARAAELERAKQDYEDYLRRRNRSRTPEVQPPEVRT